MRILVAEDDWTSRRYLVAFLPQDGYEVIETTNRHEDWEALQQPDTPSIAIIDWMMPHLSG